MIRRSGRAGAPPILGLGLLLAFQGGAAADKIKHSIAVFSGLDKITGHIISFEVGTNETVQFGTLLVTDRVCYTRPPTEAPQTDTFVQVDEIDADKKTKRIFSGWMFAASPGLNALDHPVYDIWLTGCKGTQQLIVSPSTTAATPEPDASGAGAAPAATDKSQNPKLRHRHQTRGAPLGPPVDVGPPPGFQAPSNPEGEDMDLPPPTGGHPGDGY